MNMGSSTNNNAFRRRRRRRRRSRIRKSLLPVFITIVLFLHNSWMTPSCGFVTTSPSSCFGRSSSDHHRHTATSSSPSPSSLFLRIEQEKKKGKRRSAPSRRSSSSSSNNKRRNNNNNKKRYSNNNNGYNNDYSAAQPPRQQQQRRPQSYNDEILLMEPSKVRERVADVDVIRSAQRYFRSPGVTNRRINSGGYNDDEDDDFYEVLVPDRQLRTQAKLVAASASGSSWSRDDGCVFGLYSRTSRDVVSMLPDSHNVHHPSINKAIAALQKATARVGTSAYNELTREGSLRYVQMQVERTTSKVLLTLVWNAATYKQTQPRLSRLVKQVQKLEPNLFHSVWCHCNDSNQNNMFFQRNPNRWHRISGPEFMREPIPPVDGDTEGGWLYFTPLSFRQDGFDLLATDVARAVPAGSTVCELYAGVGVLGLSALAYHHADQRRTGEPLRWLRCSDENPSYPRCFYKAVNSLPKDVVGSVVQRRKEAGLTIAELAQQMERDDNRKSYNNYNNNNNSNQRNRNNNNNNKKTSYMVASAYDALREGQALGASVLIVDPPQKGLDDGVLNELCKPFNPNQPYTENIEVLSMEDDEVNWTNDVQTLIYVSCAFDALARDCEQLLNSGSSGWMLKSATGYLLLPESDHVHTICVFQRK